MTKPFMGQIMAECDCQHVACEMRGYCMASKITSLKAELLAMAEENARLKAELAEVEGKCKVLSYVHEGAVTHARKYLQEQLDVTIDPIDMSDAIDTYLQVVIRAALKEID